MIELNDTRYSNRYEYFSTGRVIEHKSGRSVCTVARTEGGKLENVPILGMWTGGGQSSNTLWKGSLDGACVVLIKVNGIYCVLATIPEFGGVSKESLVPSNSAKSTPKLGDEE